MLRKEHNAIIHAHFVSSYGVALSVLPERFDKVVSIWGSDILLTPKINKFYYLLVKHALKKSHYQIANSDYLATRAREIVDLPYTTIPFGIDLNKFTFAKKNFNEKNKTTFQIFVAKRLHSVAGIDILLIALAKVFKSLSDINIKLTIAGSGPEELKLKRLSQRLGISEYIEWLGWCSPIEIQTILEKTHITIFPSRVEGLGVSIIEAMASGVPVLASRAGGLLELIGSDQQRGTFFELSSNALAIEIERAIINYDLISSKAIVARDYIESNYDIDKNADQLLALYKQIQVK